MQLNNTNTNLNTVGLLDGKPLSVLLCRDLLYLVLNLDLVLVLARVRAQSHTLLLPLHVTQVLGWVHRIGAFLLDHLNESKSKIIQIYFTSLCYILNVLKIIVYILFHWSCTTYLF